jgi:hypothetical protein
MGNVGLTHLSAIDKRHDFIDESSVAYFPVAPFRYLSNQSTMRWSEFC